MARFVDSVSIPPRFTGMTSQALKNPTKRKVFTILTGDHPMDEPPGRPLQKKRIDATAVITDDHRALSRIDG